MAPRLPMQPATQPPASSTRGWPAPERSVSTSPRQSFGDNRPEVRSQRQMMLAIADSPRMAAQRRQLQGLFRPSAVLQRAIDPPAFARLDHSIVQAAPMPNARLTRDADNVVCLARRATPPAVGFEVQAQDALDVWAPVTAAVLAAHYSWPDERINYRVPTAFEPNPDARLKRKRRGADNLNQVGPGGNALTIREFAGDDLAMVHHTTGGNSAPHLTVENAHISAMHHLMDMRTIEGFDKGGKTKPEHEQYMQNYGSARTDNLNFFAAGPNQAVTNLSLATYLRVIRHAMDQIANVPPVHGVEVVRSANAMAALAPLDPAALFLPSGAGQEQHLFRAALNMHRAGLIAVPAAIVLAFAGYAQPQPQLTDPVTHVVVLEGQGAWNALQNRLVGEHLAALIAYLQTL